MTKIIILFILIGVAIAQNVMAQDNNNGNWKLAKEKNGVTVFTRDSDKTKIKEFRAVTYIDTDLSSLVAVFLDIPAMEEWVRDCKSSQLIAENSDGELLYYLEVKAPFPFDNRDLVQHLAVHQDPASQEVTIELQNRPNSVPRKDNIVRMQVADGFWKFKPLGNGKIHLRFQYQNDPGGGIPAWLVNSFIVDNPLATISRLKEQVNKPRYRDAMINWITD